MQLLFSLPHFIPALEKILEYKIQSRNNNKNNKVKPQYRNYFHKGGLDGHFKIPNKLIHEKSPYLLQHAYNPVNWHPWDDEAFEKAKREDKPVFLSIGYSTCHWCHVMERESFEHQDVADILNSDFVCIKLDREERPDIDHIYMEVCMAMTGRGGWPLSVFTDADKRPFFAGTYFPKDSFKVLLAQISSLYKGNEANSVTFTGRWNMP